MRITRWLFACLLGITLSLANAEAQTTASVQWNALVDEYFDQVFFAFSPTAGTSAGLHQYDAQLEDYSRAGTMRQIAALHKFEKRVTAVDPQSLDDTAAADRQIILSNIRGTLLGLETIRLWEKNPDNYSSGITNSVYVIMSRKFASDDDRLRSVVARGACGSAKQSEESAACLHRDCAGAIAGNHCLLSN